MSMIKWNINYKNKVIMYQLPECDSCKSDRVLVKLFRFGLTRLNSVPPNLINTNMRKLIKILHQSFLCLVPTVTRIWISRSQDRRLDHYTRAWQKEEARVWYRPDTSLFIYQHIYYKNKPWKHNNQEKYGQFMAYWWISCLMVDPNQ